MDGELVRGGAYVNLLDDTKIRYRIDPDGDGVEIVALGSMELSIGMTLEVLQRCQQVLAEAQHAVARARQAM
ncbi:hypothetical protein [Actinophytocola sp.]|uniref:hypothetical protein n=1 Tax=Actinophytocola sp. TaxID=1872138 RepID=UPI002D681DBE|nr:hypothetical protein [Actinophytocola sp.]HYQ65269.1 hypothetical protein [Actinophytocola sp.]